jgi:hypothetical protein
MSSMSLLSSFPWCHPPLPFDLFCLDSHFTGLSGKKLTGFPMFNHFVSSRKGEEGRLLLDLDSVSLYYTVNSFCRTVETPRLLRTSLCLQYS